MRIWVVAIVATLVLAGLPLSSRAQPACRFVLGFAAIRDAIGPSTVGDCLVDEAYAANGDSRQPTTKGELVWRKTSNTIAFTNGYETWVNGAPGLQKRLNSERFPWEPAESVASGAATPTLAPTLPQTPMPTSTATEADRRAKAEMRAECFSSAGRHPDPLIGPRMTPFCFEVVESNGRVGLKCFDAAVQAEARRPAYARGSLVGETYACIALSGG